MREAATALEVRLGDAADALAVSALATQVFLDTYATGGVRQDLAREAFHNYSQAAFAGRLAQPDRVFVLASHGEGLVGFAEVTCCGVQSPIEGISGAELVRLYVQPRFQGRGVGRLLLARAEEVASTRGLTHLWLTAWAGNANALGFYRHAGYAEMGDTSYAFEGRSYRNHVFCKALTKP